MRALFCLLCASSALAATPTVAVMPFRDLGGGRGLAGEALRETLTTDLKQVGGMKVLERASIDKVIAEQNLGAKKSDLDQLLSVRVGTLLGASLLVTGAYQKTASAVRLTARFVKVETGEILGSAKVDGPERDFFLLQDKVAAELLRSAGLKASAPRKRPRLKSLKSVELYGEAVLEPEPAKKKVLLQQILRDEPELTYAARDLAALEGRMQGYAETAAVALAEREKALLAQATSKKSSRVAEELIVGMLNQRRCNTLATVLPTLAFAAEAVAHAQFSNEVCLHHFDRALLAGEGYLKSFPTGPHYREIENKMHEIIEVRRTRDNRRAEYESDLKEHQARFVENGKVRPDHRREYDYGPCISTRWNRQIGELMLNNCSAFLQKYEKDRSPDAQDNVLAARFFVILALAELGDFRKAKPLADKLRTDSDEWDAELQKLTAEWPTD